MEKQVSRIYVQNVVCTWKSFLLENKNGKLQFATCAMQFPDKSP